MEKSYKVIKQVSTEPFFEKGETLYVFDIVKDKVVGRVSEYAKWIKEGDLLDEEEIEVNHEHYSKRSKYLEIGDVVRMKPENDEARYEYPNDAYGKIKSITIKDVEFGSWDWDDTFEITDIKQNYYPLDDEGAIDWPENEGVDDVYPEYKWPFNELPDRKLRREDLEFLPIAYVYCKVKCSQCDVFH